MPRFDLQGLGRHVGQAVPLRGWVVTTRSSGKIAFVVVRDGTGYVQAAVARKAVSDGVGNGSGTLAQPASVAVDWDVRQESRSPGGYELTVTGLTITGPS